MKKLFLITSLIFSSLIYSQVNEKILNDNFSILLESNKACYLIVFEDLNTNETKEICILDEDFIKAFELEHHIIYDDTKIYDPFEKYFKTTDLIKKNGSRNFKFKNPGSLEILNKNYIQPNDLENFKKRVDINSIIEDFKKGKDIFIDIDQSNFKDINYYIYLLSKEGFRMCHDLYNCFSPNSLFCCNCQKE